MDKLRELLTQKDPEEMSSYHFIKIVYAMGTVKNINMDQTFDQVEIPNGA